MILLAKADVTWPTNCKAWGTLMCIIVWSFCVLLQLPGPTVHPNNRKMLGAQYTKVKLPVPAIARVLNRHEYAENLPAEEAQLLMEYFTSNDDTEFESELDSESDIDEATQSEEIGDDNNELRCIGDDYNLGVIADDCDLMNSDDEELQKVKSFDCGCKNYQSGSCCKQFSLDTIISHRQMCAERDYYNDEHYNYLCEHLISQMDALTCDSALVYNSEKSKKKHTARKQTQTLLMFHGVHVCLKFYLFLHNLNSVKRWRNLKSRWKDHHLELIQHGNTGCKGNRALKIEDVRYILRFIDNYADVHALVLPGRIPGVNNPDVKVLPSAYTKAQVYRTYSHACDTHAVVTKVSYNTFVTYWNRLRPNIVIQMPRSDLCQTCKFNTLQIGKLRNLSENDYVQLLQKSMKHLDHVKEEREYMKGQIMLSKLCFEQAKACGFDPNNSHDAVTYEDGPMHISFDFAQQIHLPHSPEQEGPMYFKTGYKVGIFGLQNDTIQKQYNYVIPESVLTGKGANEVISLLHHYFINFGLGECVLNIHADNCCAQNKNNFMMFYLGWRIANNLHDTIEISFLPVGHTKFSPDAAFGIFKSCFRRTEVATIDEVVKCFENSTPQSRLNCAIPTGTIDGTVLVPTMDWQTYFAKCTKIKGIKKYQHFEFSAKWVGEVKCRERVDGEVVNVHLFNPEDYQCTELPELVQPAGLSLQRQLYLYNTIREHVPIDAKDILCPEPKS